MGSLKLTYRFQLTFSQEREKKAKKKASASVATDPEELAEAGPEDAEPEKIDEDVETSFPAKEKVQMEKTQKANTIKQRNRSKGADSVPKVILKRKKSTNYWIWAAPAAVLVLLLLALGYYYLF